ncbi:MAG: hypothetical protein J7501_13330 [Bdellovibrio sp.]|nr:hypothetical protein [Bdellovibrio sp.]
MLPTNKHALITAILLASLSITACGSKKSAMSGPKPTKTTNVEAPAAGGSTESDLPGFDDTYNPPTNGKPGKAPPVVSNPSVPAPGNLSPDYQTNNPQNVANGGYGKRFTGGVSEDGLLYTSSSTDSLIDFIRTRTPVSAMAGAITSAKMSVDGMSGDVNVTVKLMEGGEEKVYNIAGSNGFEYGSSSTVLRGVREANGERTTGGMPAEGTLKCMDLDGGCETSLLKLNIGYVGANSVVYIVFRSTQTSLYFHLPAESKESANPEYQVLKEMAINTINKLTYDNRLESARLDSWEVVNGRSGFASVMKTYSKELLGFAGPLLAPESGTGVNIPLARLNKDQNDSLDLLALTDTRLNYANSIGSARLIANNGLGQIRIALKMRKRGNYAQDQFAITIMRKINPIIELNNSILK